ncbi:uncharacterized protein [Diadema antillarum]|uniref:uncharacterized protein n=1 Tax=Diadema antillarum TaxID=105358 RepID=UPI003A87CCF2
MKLTGKTYTFGSFSQGSVEKITRSFMSLELISKNPTILEDNPVDKKVQRSRRGVDSSETPNLPATQQSSDQNPQGSFELPLLSGQCLLCPSGVPGPRGPPGPPGVAGADGRDGKDVLRDMRGVDGSPEIAQEPAKITSNSKDDASTLQDDGQDGEQTHSDDLTVSGNGAVYVRWGKPDCPQDAELIYSGSVGGESNANLGGSSSYLCLPDEPIYDEVETSASTLRAYVYSSEFETSTFVGHWQALQDLTPSCAVCRAPSERMTQLMIPARNVCPSDDWHLEYAGYLMSERYTLKRTEYICMDRDAEPVPGTRGNQNGATLYHVEGRCLDGSGLPCGPYVHGYELTCAVCTI